MRCRKCPGCFEHRKRLWVAKLLWRFENNGNKVRRVYFWTLGTNRAWSSKNIEWIMSCWTKFRKRVNNNQSRKKWFGRWKPLLYVVEEGSKGRKLHVHVVASGFLRQDQGRLLWDEITETTNTNFGYSPPQSWHTPIMAMIYLSKYLSKNMKNWYWMGVMLKKVPKKTFYCNQVMFDKSKCGDWLYKYQVGVFNIAEDYEFWMLPSQGTW